MFGGTKAGELDRTCEVCLEILEREGNNFKGLYFLVAFLKDQGRPLNDVLESLDKRIKRGKGNERTI